MRSQVTKQTRTLQYSKKDSFKRTVARVFPHTRGLRADMAAASGLVHPCSIILDRGCPIDKSEGVVKDRGFLWGAMSTAAVPEG